MAHPIEGVLGGVRKAALDLNNASVEVSRCRNLATDAENALLQATKEHTAAKLAYDEALGRMGRFVGRGT